MTESGGGKLAFALGGGGARGVAHLGVLQALEEAGIRPDMIIGTSMGALAAGLYAVEPDAKAMSKRVVDYLNSINFAAYGKNLAGSAPTGILGRMALNVKRAAALSLMSFAGGLVNPMRLREAIDGVLADKQFDECEIPTYITAFDVLAAKTILLDSGSLRDAVTASCNLAGFFPPVRADGKVLCDASPIVSVPCIEARNIGASKVIAVDIRANIPPVEDVYTGTDVVMRLTAATSTRAAEIEIEAADVVIAPDVNHLFWSDFRDLDQLVEMGRDAAMAKIDEVKALAEDDS